MAWHTRSCGFRALLTPARYTCPAAQRSSAKLRLQLSVLRIAVFSMQPVLPTCHSLELSVAPLLLINLR